MGPPKAFDLTGDVAIVTGAGSRMDGESAGERYSKARQLLIPSTRGDWEWSGGSHFAGSTRCQSGARGLQHRVGQGDETHD